MWNSKVRYRIYKLTPPFPTLRQMNLVPSSHLTSRRSILILFFHPSLGLPSRPFRSGFATKPCMHLSSPHTCCMSGPSNSSWFHHLKNIELTVQIINLLTMQFSPLCCYLVPLRANIILNTPFTNTLSLRSSLNMNDRVSHPYKQLAKLKFCISWCLYFRIGNCKTKHSAPNDSSIHCLQSALNFFLNTVLIR